MEPADEVPLEGGMVSTVVRVGDTVRRPLERWSSAAHGVLRHLASVGFDAAPKLLGVDEQHREILQWIPGEPATRPWPPELLRPEGLIRLAELLRRYHHAMQEYRPPPDTEWWIGQRVLGDREVVLHGDPGPWNTIWRDGAPVAFVDFDFVVPGPPIRDLAYAAFFCVPMGDDDHCRECGFEAAPDRAQRLKVFLEGYGWSESPSAVIDYAIGHWRQEAIAIESLGSLGVKPWDGFLERKLHDEDRRIVHWLETNRDLFE